VQNLVLQSFVNPGMGKKIVFCNCGGDTIEPERLKEIEKNLIELNIDLIKLSDLCGLSVLNKEKLRTVFSVNDEYLIIGCHSRALKLLLANAGIILKDFQFKFINFFEADNEKIIRETSSFNISNDRSKNTAVKEIRSSSDWPSWFPVIDYARCSACGQCADFCLFGVYEKTDEKVSVINPQECKNNCPACARICPQTAIIFPKYKSGGAISGSDMIDEITEQKRQTEDINSILNSDIYSALEARKKKRKSIILKEEMNKAIEERQNALNNLNPESR
jgi:NAD-dependent dihydropyrimidine dehydrogenase PreA subunit